MQTKIGNDIIEVQRIKQAIEKIGEDFLKKIYTEKEIQYCESKKISKYQHYAARFAAKEAVFKAISEHIKGREDAVWRQIEILNEPNGRPYINKEKLNLPELQSIDISISHIKEYAVASAVAIFN